MQSTDMSTQSGNKYKRRRVIICSLVWNISFNINHHRDFVSAFRAEPTCRFDSLPSHCDLHSCADQDPYGVVLWVQQLVPGLKRETNRETSQEEG